MRIKREIMTMMMICSRSMAMASISLLHNQIRKEVNPLLPIAPEILIVTSKLSLKMAAVAWLRTSKYHRSRILLVKLIHKEMV